MRWTRQLRRLRQVADFFDFGRSLEALLNDRDEDVRPSCSSTQGTDSDSPSL